MCVRIPHSNSSTSMYRCAENRTLRATLTSKPFVFAAWTSKRTTEAVKSGVTSLERLSVLGTENALHEYWTANHMQTRLAYSWHDSKAIATNLSRSLIRLFVVIFHQSFSRGAHDSLCLSLAFSLACTGKVNFHPTKPTPLRHHYNLHFLFSYA